MRLLFAGFRRGGYVIQRMQLLLQREHTPCVEVSIVHGITPIVREADSCKILKPEGDEVHCLSIRARSPEHRVAHLEQLHFVVQLLQFTISSAHRKRCSGGSGRLLHERGRGGLLAPRSHRR